MKAQEMQGKYMFGMVTVGAKGQIVIPKEARDVFGIQPGDRLLLLGDNKQGLALLTKERSQAVLEGILAMQGE